jgi:hypothetical protein
MRESVFLFKSAILCTRGFGKQKHSQRNLPLCHLAHTTGPTWSGLGSVSNENRLLCEMLLTLSVVRISVGKNYMDFKKTKYLINHGLPDIKMYLYHMFLEMYMEVSVIDNIEILIIW